MADTKPISPGLKMALELGPVLAFFVLYMRIREDVFTFGGVEYSGFIVATVAFIPVLLLAMGILWKLSGKISRMQVFTAFMVIFFGGLTVWFNDERFFKMKTTIVYGFFVVILGVGLLRGKSLLAYVMEDMLPMTEEGFLILTKRLTAAFAVLAVANEIVWRTMSTDTWVKIETFGFPAALFVFLMLQSKLFETYSTETDET